MTTRKKIPKSNTLLYINNMYHVLSQSTLKVCILKKQKITNPPSSQNAKKDNHNDIHLNHSFKNPQEAHVFPYSSKPLSNVVTK